MLNSHTRAAEAYRISLLIALCGVLFFFRLGASPLWEIDEGMHAATAAEMLRSGDWLTPTFNGEPFFDKPVMFNWLTAISLRLLGYTELAARLPDALLGLGTVLATYALGRRMYGALAGFLAGAVLASAGMFVALSRVVVHDMCLTFFLTLALAFYYMGLTTERRRRLYLFGAWALLGGAMLTKGPIGLVLPAGIVGLYALWVRDLGVLRRSQIPLGIALVLVVAGPWYLMMHQAHPDYLRYFIIEQHIGNVGGETPRHSEPFYFYLPVLLGGFFPWTLFLPAAFVLMRPGRATSTARATGFLWAWVLVPFLLFSAATSKLPTYVLPIFPPLALLVGGTWAQFLESAEGVPRRSFIAGSALLAVLGLGGLVSSFVAPPVGLEQNYGIDLDHVSMVVGVLALGFGISLLLALRRQAGAAFGAVVATMVAMFLMIATLILPCVDPYRSTRDMLLPLDSALPPGEKLVFLEAIVGVADSALFYTDRKATVLTNGEALEEFLASEQRVYGLSKRGPLRVYSTPNCTSYVLERSGKRLIFSNHEGPLSSH